MDICFRHLVGTLVVQGQSLTINAAAVVSIPNKIEDRSRTKEDNAQSRNPLLNSCNEARLLKYLLFLFPRSGDEAKHGG